MAKASACFVLSAVSGVERGIKYLSNANAIAAGLLVLFLFVVGPTVFIMGTFTQTIGDYLTHLPSMAFSTGVYDSLFAFTTGTYPIKIHQVAKYLTKVDIGATFIGAITINKTLYDSMPPEVQKILQEVGAEYTRRVATTLSALAAQFEAKMAAEGAIISEFPKEQRLKWATTMPNIAQDWVKRNEERKLPARLVLKTYLDKLRASGQQPLRNWDQD